MISILDFYTCLLFLLFTILLQENLLCFKLNIDRNINFIRWPFLLLPCILLGLPLQPLIPKQVFSHPGFSYVFHYNVYYFLNKRLYKCMCFSLLFFFNNLLQIYTIFAIRHLWCSTQSCLLVQCCPESFLMQC